MSITFQRKGIRYQEVWFDEPVAAGQDIIIGYQRPECPPGVQGRPFHTLVLDLRQTSNELLAALDKDVRYELRRSEKDALTFECLAEPAAYLDDFCRFYNVFALDKGLDTIVPSGLMPVVSAGHLILTRIQKDGATLIWHAYRCVGGRARLLHSASLFRGQESAQRALTGRANRFLHWRDILEFKQRGYRIYDFGGWTLPEQADEAKARINDFKAGFGGRQVQEYHLTYPLSAKGRVWLLLRRLKARLQGLRDTSKREQ